MEGNLLPATFEVTRILVQPTNVIIHRVARAAVRVSGLDHRGQWIGSRSAVSYTRTRQPQVFICGHVHEAAGEAQLRGTQILNVAGRVELLEVIGGRGRDD